MPSTSVQFNEWSNSEPMRVEAALFCGLRGSLTGKFRHACKIALVQRQKKVLLVGEHVLSERRTQRGEFLYDRGKARACAVLELGAGAYEVETVLPAAPPVLASVTPSFVPA